MKAININNKTESNPKIMAETFNKFFLTIARDKDSKISTPIPITKIISKTLYLTHFY